MEYTDLLHELLQEEQELQFTRFTNETALQIGCRIAEVVRLENKTVTVDIRRNGQQLFHYASPGTSADNDEWVLRKSRVVDRFGHSSKYMEVLLKSTGRTLQQRFLLDPAEYAAYGGSFPIIIKDVGPVGTISVSEYVDDHRLVTQVLREFVGRQEL
ncbi:heme-degrading domain-containing protein [Paenibacillus sp. TAB 01]|uniref:heme-degrading domain-containing protein n=1 Tax=Paenibacillus sp. TAB 01 TaxID=3368988 RepID=UPI00374FECFF